MVLLNFIVIDFYVIMITLASFQLPKKRCSQQTRLMELMTTTFFILTRVHCTARFMSPWFAAISRASCVSFSDSDLSYCHFSMALKNTNPILTQYSAAQLSTSLWNDVVFPADLIAVSFLKFLLLRPLKGHLQSLILITCTLINLQINFQHHSMVDSTSFNIVV